jgi:hypothetical protein
VYWVLNIFFVIACVYKVDNWCDKINTETKLSRLPPLDIFAVLMFRFLAF